MIGRSLFNGVKSFDIYKKVPKELTYATYTGALSI